MIAPPSLTIAPLTAGAAGFAPLTFPRLAGVVSTLPLPWFAAGATVNGVPAGLALGCVADDGAARLVSLSVASPFRRRGVATALVAAWENTARDRGAATAWACHTDRLPGRAGLAGVLVRAGWPPPRPFEIHAIGCTGAMVAAVAGWPAMAGRLRETRAVTFAPWTTPDDDDRAAIAALSVEPDFLSTLAPAACLERLEPACSIAVRRKGRLVGWVLGERATRVPLAGYENRPAVYYRSAYLARSLWHTGVLVGAYWHAYDRQATALGRESIAMFRTVMPRMMTLVRRRFAPISLLVSESLATGRSLRTP